MGVSGAGKTTVGRLLAERLGWAFEDADSFHSPANRAKMAAGQPLEDADRWPWLDAMRAAVESWIASGRDTVLACSALKRSYRRRLGIDGQHVRLVYLDVAPDEVARRLAGRSHAFMRPGLLDSQFQTLEVPATGIHVDASLAPEQVVEAAVSGLALA